MVLQVNPLGYDIQRMKDQFSSGYDEETAIFRLFYESLKANIDENEIDDDFSVLDTQNTWDSTGTCSVSNNNLLISNGSLTSQNTFKYRTALFNSLNVTPNLSNDYWGFRANASNFALFRSNNGVLTAEIANSIATQSTVISSYASSSQHNFKIMWRYPLASQGDVVFYMDDANVCEYTTNIPTMDMNVVLSDSSSDILTSGQITVSYEPILFKSDVSGDTMIWGNDILGIWNTAYWGDSIYNDYTVVALTSNPVYTDAGKGQILNKMTGTTSSNPAYIGIATGLVSYNNLSTSLSNEISTRQPIYYSDCSSDRETRLSYKVSNIIATGTTVTTAALFTATGSNAVMHAVFGHEGVNKTYYEDWLYHVILKVDNS